MDPNATLARIRVLLVSSDPDDMTELAELIHSLDEWLAAGGFPPDAWDHPRSIPPRRPAPGLIDRLGTGPRNPIF